MQMRRIVHTRSVYLHDLVKLIRFTQDRIILMHLFKGYTALQISTHLLQHISVISFAL